MMTQRLTSTHVDVSADCFFAHRKFQFKTKPMLLILVNMKTQNTFLFLQKQTWMKSFDLQEWHRRFRIQEHNVLQLLSQGLRQCFEFQMFLSWLHLPNAPLTFTNSPFNVVVVSTWLHMFNCYTAVMKLENLVSVKIKKTLDFQQKVGYIWALGGFPLARHTPV